DVLSGTTSGPELPPGPFETWKFQRNIVNRYFQSLGWSELANINVNQKLWCDGPYGRERIFFGELMENRNMLTTEAVAKLLHCIIGGVAVSPGRSQMMMDLLQGDLEQVTGFLGEALPPGSQQWSIAGSNESIRNNAAYIELPSHNPYLLAVFTEGRENAQNHQLLPFVSQVFLKAQENLTA
ncbi:MAG: serine hydrolase, partial [Okeania sp. SIO2D1]|nr:serine hydrolase [Okeania sp. SIO2D1]